MKVVDEVRLEDDWVPLDEQLGPEELEEVFRAKEAHSRAVVLETVSFITCSSCAFNLHHYHLSVLVLHPLCQTFPGQIGDIPDAEIKPPDNVLFVCKLNPVTEVSSYYSH